MARLVAVAALGTTLAAPAPSASAATGLTVSLSGRMTLDCITPGNLYLLGDCGDLLKSTYVEETLPKAGRYTLGKTSFTWPKMDLRTNDTMQSLGQTFTLPKPRGYRSIALLGAYRSGVHAGHVGSIVVKYTDRTSERVRFRAHGWKYFPEKSDIKGVRVQTGATVLYTEGRITKALARINPKKAVASIQLPHTTSPPLFVWAISLSHEPAPANP